MKTDTALLTDLDAFLQEHRRCGDLDGGLERGPREYPTVWLACSCGAVFCRPMPFACGGDEADVRRYAAVRDQTLRLAAETLSDSERLSSEPARSPRLVHS